LADIRQALRAIERARSALNDAAVELQELADLNLSDGELLTVAELSSCIDTHPETIRRWARTGRIPVADRGPFKQSRPRFRLADVLEALRSGQAAV